LWWDKKCEQWLQTVVVMRSKLWIVTYNCKLGWDKKMRTETSNCSCDEKNNSEQWLQTVGVMI